MLCLLCFEVRIRIKGCENQLCERTDIWWRFWQFFLSYEIFFEMYNIKQTNNFNSYSFTCPCDVRSMNYTFISQYYNMLIFFKTKIVWVIPCVSEFTTNPHTLMEDQNIFFSKNKFSISYLYVWFELILLFLMENES